MRLSDIAISRPVFTLVIAISTVVFGLLGYLGMGIDLFPEVEFPVVTISSTLEGASPEVVELTVTKVIEDEVGTLDQIETITSFSSFGSSNVVVEFALEKDINEAVQEVRDRVAAAQRLLPDEMDPPLIQKLNIADQPIMWVAASTEGEYWPLARWSDQVAKDRIEQIEGVGSVLLGAFRDRAYRVWLVPKAMAARNVGPLDVAAAIRAKHVELPAGKAEGSKRDLPIRVFGEFDSAEDLGSLIVRGGQKPVRLRDVARVEAGLEDATSVAHFNGVPAIGFGVRKQSGANTVEVAERVKAALPRLQEMAPEGVTLHLAFDSSRFIRNSITGVQFDIAFGALLTALVIFLFLQSARATVIASLAIPTSLISTFALMNAAGFTMNNLTMLALSLAVGMVIDDAIVVIEAIYRHLEQGKKPMQAAREAMGEIGFAVIVTTAAVVAVFVPIAFMKGIIGRFFLQFGLTVSFAMIISTVIALTLVPMMSSRLLRRAAERRRMGLLGTWGIVILVGGALALFIQRHLGDYRYSLLVGGALFAFALLKNSFDRIFSGLEAAYRVVLRICLRFRALTVVVATALFLSGTWLGLSPLVSKEFARPADEARFIVRFETQLGTSLEETARRVGAVEEAIFSHPEIQGAFVAAGFGAGAAPQPHTGISFVNMFPSPERGKSQDQVMDELRKELNAIPGIVAFVDRITPLGGGQRRTDLQYVVQGPNIEELATYAGEVVTRMRRSAGYLDVDTDIDIERPEARVEIDRERSELLSVDADEITAAINMMMGGADVAYLTEGGERYDIRLRAERSLNQDPRDILDILVRNRDGRMVQIGNVVSVEEGIGPNVINHYNRQRAATLYANLGEGKPLGEALSEMEEIIRDVLPPDSLYSAEVAGTSKTFQESFQYLLQALLLAVLIVYLVLAAQFESFLHPFTIMMTLPLAVTGVFGGLAVTGLSLDIFSFIGIVMLTGIVTKNGILLVDYANQLRSAGQGRNEALLAAGPVRLRPVMMTAITTMAGMTAVALAFSEGAESRASMGVAVIGGMFSSTPLTLVVIPVVYTLLDDAVQWGAKHARALRRLLVLAALGATAAGAAADFLLGSLFAAAALAAGTFVFILLLGSVGLAIWARIFGSRVEEVGEA